MKPNDNDILNARATHPICGALQFERAQQDRRTYYRLVMVLMGTRRGGSLTTAQSARETIAYWESRGWLDNNDGGSK